MLESIVSVLPADWFPSSGWPRFQLADCNHSGGVQILDTAVALVECVHSGFYFFAGL